MKRNNTRKALLESIAKTISDYRRGELSRRTPKHVNRWIKQFDEDVQIPMLEELNHIFTRTYLRNEHFDAFLSSLVENEKLTGGNHIQFWKKVNFLDIQQAGFSQMEMLSAFERVLLDKCGLAINDCRSYSNVYVYLDDGICSGGRVTSDLTDWIENEAPERAIVHILVMYLYSYGKYKALKQLKQTAEECGEAHNLQILEGARVRKQADL